MLHGTSDLSLRISTLKQKMLEEARYMSAEQAKIIDKSHQLYIEDPVILKRAKTLKDTFQKMQIRIEPGELIVGNRTYGVRSGVVFPECGLNWLANEIDDLQTRPQDVFYTNEEDVKYVKEELLPKWKNHTLERLIYKGIGQIDDQISSVVKVNQKGRAQGHIIPNISKWLHYGPCGLIEEAKKRLANAKETENIIFYESVIVALEGVIGYLKRYALLAQELAQTSTEYSEDLGNIAKICTALTNRAPSTFHEALQAVWILMACLHMESNASSFSFGRLDQYLQPYYEKDISEGVLSERFALELIECFFLKLNQIVCMTDSLDAKYFAGFPIGFNLAIGGRDETGALLENDLTFLMLRAQKALHLPQPNLSARLSYNSSNKFLEMCADVIGDGGGLPQFFNDESIIPTLERVGLSKQDAAQYGIVGCVELTGSGNMLGWSNAAMFNVVKVLELTLNHGVCLLTDQQLAPDLGGLDTFETFEQMEAALYKQLSYFIKQMVICHKAVDKYHGQYMQSALLSSVVDDCLENGKDVTVGGARYNSSGIQFVQIANFVDSLAVLKYLVFAGKISKNTLLDQMRDNFTDVYVKNVVENITKYGNDDTSIDYLGNKWIQFIEQELDKYTNQRGGKFHIGLYTVSSHVPMGENVGATCDGRKSGEPLADGGISPSSGADRLGPTAILKSASNIEFNRIANGSLLNMKFSQSMFLDKRSRERFVALLRAFVSLGLQHVQFNVVDKEQLLAAQKEPEKHKNLLIRVAGYTAYFVDLDHNLQDEIIRRTECVL